MSDRPKGKTVWLLVEDDPTLRLMITTFMRDLWGMEPLAFSDGFQMMRWLDDVEKHPERSLPEIALLDQQLPGPDGPEIARRMRTMEITHDLPIVLLTAAHLDSREVLEIKRMAEPDRIVPKPLPAPDDLKAVLDEVISARRQANPT